MPVGPLECHFNKTEEGLGPLGLEVRGGPRTPIAAPVVQRHDCLGHG